MTPSEQEQIISLTPTKLVYYLIKRGKDGLMDTELLNFILGHNPSPSIPLVGIDNIPLVQILFSIMVESPKFSQSQIIRVLTILHEHGYDLNVVFEDMWSIVVEKEYIFLRNAFLHLYYSDTPTILYFAIERDMAKVAEFIAGLGIIDNEQDVKGNTCLHLAMYYDMSDLVEILVANGCDLEIKNSDGQSPMSISTEGFCAKSVKDAFNRGLQKRSKAS